MYDKTPYFYGTGRRKSSVARVRLYQGTGKITINDRDIDDYFGLETLKTILRQPLVLTGTIGKFDVLVNRLVLDNGLSVVRLRGVGRPCGSCGSGRFSRSSWCDKII